MSDDGRRAILLTKYDAVTPDLETLTRRHGLEVVFTITGPSMSRLAALIAVQHVLEHGVEVVIIPHLTTDEIRTDRPWRAVRGLVDIVASNGLIECSFRGLSLP